jgi:hypothetical protein
MRNSRDVQHCRFRPDEDVRLKELVAQHGSADWRAIADAMNGRNPRQCRERWKHSLSCNKHEVPWTKREDDILLEKVQELGPKWTKIGGILGDRTDLEVKNRWMQTLAPGLSRPPRPQRQCRLANREAPPENSDTPDEATKLPALPQIPPPPPQPETKERSHQAPAIVVAVDHDAAKSDSDQPPPEWPLTWEYHW